MNKMNTGIQSYSSASERTLIQWSCILNALIHMQFWLSVAGFITATSLSQSETSTVRLQTGRCHVRSDEFSVFWPPNRWRDETHLGAWLTASLGSRAKNQLKCLQMQRPGVHQPAGGSSARQMRIWNLEQVVSFCSTVTFSCWTALRCR